MGSWGWIDTASAIGSQAKKLFRCQCCAYLSWQMLAALCPLPLRRFMRHSVTGNQHHSRNRGWLLNLFKIAIDDDCDGLLSAPAQIHSPAETPVAYLRLLISAVKGDFATTYRLGATQCALTVAVMDEKEVPQAQGGIRGTARRQRQGAFDLKWKFQPASRTSPIEGASSVWKFEAYVWGDWRSPNGSGIAKKAPGKRYSCLMSWAGEPLAALLKEK